jgi:hypothetical protein
VKMELKDFIVRALADIVGAVKESQEAAKEVGARIAPDVVVRDADRKTLTRSGEPITQVEFDVAVTASDSSETKGGVGVLAGIFTLGSAGQSASGSSSVTRIRFAVPVVFPTQFK